MIQTHPPIDTPIATVQLTAADRVEVRFKPGSKFTVDGITTILKAREKIGEVSGPARVLIVFPDEEVVFDMAMITTDHYRGRPVQQHSRAVAWVVHNDLNDRFTRLYFSYYPSPVPSAIFMTEEEAVAWLEKQ